MLDKGVQAFHSKRSVQRNDRGIARIGFGMKNKANLEETVAICDQLRILVVDIFKRKEIKKGDRGKWRNKARRLLRQISESI